MISFSGNNTLKVLFRGPSLECLLICSEMVVVWAGSFYFLSQITLLTFLLHLALHPACYSPLVTGWLLYFPGTQKCDTFNYEWVLLKASPWSLSHPRGVSFSCLSPSGELLVVQFILLYLRKVYLRTLRGLKFLKLCFKETAFLR